ncbi:hypothetical protein WICMUC_005017 [Wickerhamomyces mucosus]|uniref:Uncharacterized protein n=1 Tax=Wickerhamomyces mucosus TaxID=1378264 RepID=A0A9P8PBI2_9ASCO|nr:hypothetical protein WICMUC_005017 [Wickerhamomyces mucosus]
MFASAQFQYTGLLERMNYQKQIILKLNEKVNKQKNLLILAKEKVLKVEELENRIKILERENRELSISKLQSPSNGDIRNPPATVDLTIDDNSFEQEQENLDSRRDRRTVAASFIDQIKKNSTNSKFPSYRSSTSHIPHESNNQAIVTKNSDHDDNSYFAKSRIGESTNILQNSPIRSIPSNISHSNYSSRSSSIGSLNTSISSHDNFIQPVPWTKLSAPHPLSTSNNLDAPRVSKSRASTSSLAQRLSAHMKVGNSLINRRSESTGTTRPGSSFTNNSSIFKRR